MKKTSPILRRLPVYLHYLKNDTKDRVSSRELALALGFTEILVRKDLASISDGGMRKLGHYRQRLIGDIEQFLSCDCTHEILQSVLQGSPSSHN